MQRITRSVDSPHSAWTDRDELKVPRRCPRRAPERGGGTEPSWFLRSSMREERSAIFCSFLISARVSAS